MRGEKRYEIDKMTMDEEEGREEGGVFVVDIHTLWESITCWNMSVVLSRRKENDNVISTNNADNDRILQERCNREGCAASVQATFDVADTTDMVRCTTMALNIG